MYKTTQKYRNRPSPPFKANFCIGQRKKGNDGQMYRSKAYEFGPARWVLSRKYHTSD